jgi:hypothetical protein
MQEKIMCCLPSQVVKLGGIHALVDQLGHFESGGDRVLRLEALAALYQVRYCLPLPQDFSLAIDMMLQLYPSLPAAVVRQERASQHRIRRPS